MYLNNFLGNKELIKTIKSNAKASLMPHAIIIEGPEGSGKNSLARYISLVLACDNSPDVCMKCPPCRKILTANSPDVIYADLPEGKSQIGIDTVRFIRSDVYIKPNDNRYKLYIIKHADKMTTEAQNAFLKVLEEPPQYAVFILLCNSADSLLITVKSRCTVYTTERFDTNILADYLIDTDEEAKDLFKKSPDAFRLAILLSKGSVGLAKYNISSDSASVNLKLYNAVVDLIMLLRKRASSYDILEHLSSLEQTKDYIDNYFSMLESALMEIVAFKVSDARVSEFFIDTEQLDYICAGMSDTFILEAIDNIENFRFMLTTNVGLQTSLMAISSQLAVLRNKY